MANIPMICCILHIQSNDSKLFSFRWGKSMHTQPNPNLKCAFLLLFHGILNLRKLLGGLQLIFPIDTKNWEV